MLAADDAKNFMNALHAAESTRNTDALVLLFADDGFVDSIASQEKHIGREAIKAFWDGYVKIFGSIETSFTTVTSSEVISVLEWKSKGKLPGGEKIDYRGVSLLQFAAGKVKSFRTYYDSAAFVPEFEKHLKRIPSSQ